MSRVVCVHGIGQQHSGEQEQHSHWYPALADGLHRVGARPLEPADVHCVFYGDLFRPPGRTLAVQDPPLDASDVGEGFETDLLLALWAEAARTDEGVMPPDARTLARTPQSRPARPGRTQPVPLLLLDRPARPRARSPAGPRLPLRMPPFATPYNNGSPPQVTPRTEMVVGHSLGSVVAYEALCAHPEWPVRALLTLGSPLGIRNLVFDKLRAGAGGKPGDWPGAVWESWTNIADEGDVVALVKDLRPLFGDAVRCHLVHNGSRAHDATRYLNTVEAGGPGGRPWLSSRMRAGEQAHGPPRRYLITAAVPRVHAHPDLDRPELADDVRRMEDLFVGLLGYERAAVTGPDPTKEQLLKALRTFAVSEEQRRTTTWSSTSRGTGPSRNSGRHYLLTADSDHDLRGTALRSEDLVGELWDETGIERLLVLLDACHSRRAWTPPCAARSRPAVSDLSPARPRATVWS